MLDFLSFDMEVEREEMEETSIKMPSHLDNGRFFTHVAISRGMSHA